MPKVHVSCMVRMGQKAILLGLAVYSDGSVLKTKQLGLVYLATVGLGLGCSWAIYRPAKRIKIGPNFGPLGPAKINK